MIAETLMRILWPVPKWPSQPHALSSPGEVCPITGDVANTTAPLLLYPRGSEHPLTYLETSRPRTSAASRGDKHSVRLTSRFEATGGKVRDEPRNFEPWSDDEDDAWAGTPSPSFRATLAGARLATTYDLACSRPHVRRIFDGIGFRACDPPVPRSRHCH
ncbi:hypothetical protein AVEN_194524-1 [Araneus ventricosus]|uniref:Uncharacterized protein n=1 Tax=Araneus ventricosus TaxID=182803 RepID=A0A4Y2A6W3_ARAVE|nr:hypothetical protein AVEN_194524-1 [Araneus ventricosus]